MFRRKPALIAALACVAVAATGTLGAAQASTGSTGTTGATGTTGTTTTTSVPATITVNGAGLVPVDPTASTATLQAAYMTALTAAVNAAHAKATALSSQVGDTLGAVQNITEQSNSINGCGPAIMNAAGSSRGVPVPTTAPCLLYTSPSPRD